MMNIDEAADDFELLDSNLKMGCIARLYAEVKHDIVRQIRKVGVSTHGVKVFRPLTSIRFALCQLLLFLTNCVFSRIHLVLLVNITRPSNTIEEYNRFRKRYKGVEFTIIRTKGDATAGDVSSEDEGSNDLQDSGDSEQEQAISDDLEPRVQGSSDILEPREPAGNSEKEADRDNVELQESGEESDREANSRGPRRHLVRISAKLVSPSSLAILTIPAPCTSRTQW